MKGVLICKIGALCANISGPIEGSSQEQTVSKATKDDEEGNEQQFINKPAAVLPTLRSFLPEEKGASIPGILGSGKSQVSPGATHSVVVFSPFS